mgnify:CR=1 FL=1
MIITVIPLLHIELETKLNLRSSTSVWSFYSIFQFLRFPLSPSWSGFRLADFYDDDDDEEPPFFTALSV